jgi:hypothetical protein
MLEQDLRAHYELARNLPHQLLTLLVELNDDPNTSAARSTSRGAAKG